MFTLFCGSKDGITAVPCNPPLIEAHDILAPLPGKHGAQHIGGLALPHLRLCYRAVDAAARDMLRDIPRRLLGRSQIDAAVRGDVPRREEGVERLKVRVLIVGSIERGNIVPQAAPLPCLLVVAEPIGI